MNEEMSVIKVQNEQGEYLWIVKDNIYHGDMYNCVKLFTEERFANSYLKWKKIPGEFFFRQYVVCNDGFTFSAQAGCRLHHCSPRGVSKGPFTEYEVMILKEFPETEYPFEGEPGEDTVIHYAKEEEINALIAKHGGIKDKPYHTIFEYFDDETNLWRD